MGNHLQWNSNSAGGPHNAVFVVWESMLPMSLVWFRRPRSTRSRCSHGCYSIITTFMLHGSNVRLSGRDCEPMFVVVGGFQSLFCVAL